MSKIECQPLCVNDLLLLSNDLPQDLQNVESSSISLPQCLQYIIYIILNIYTVQLQD